MDQHDLLEKLAFINEDCVLATIMSVEGSAYRKSGTLMFFTKSEQRTGMISVGCLEDDLAIRANQLLKVDDIHSEIITYDMSAEDDLGWGRGIGCNGKVIILLEKIQREQQNNLKKVWNSLNDEVDVIAIKNISFVPKFISTVYITEKEDVFGDDVAIDDDPFKRNRLNKVVGNKYIHHFKPKARLFIFGAGEDVKPLANVAIQTGFSVYIWDWREALLEERFFPKATLIHGDSIREIQFNKSDFIVIMTHDFQKDKQILHKLIRQQPFRYLGILGPRKRTKRLLNGQEIPKHFHSPVGLAIGADGAEEIAISIVADLIRIKRGVSNVERHSRNLFSSG